MSKNSSFTQQYKHPEWQKKRLEAMSAAEFICQRCYGNEMQLHVHHKRYVSGRLLWEYQVNELEVLCEECHQEAHREKDILYDFLSRFPTEAIAEFIGLLAGYASVVTGPSGHAKTEDIISSSSSYLVTEAGKIAATLCNKYTLQSIMVLHDQINNTQDGGSFVFTVPIKKPFIYGTQ